MAKKILLISTSTTFGTGYLDHAEKNIKELLNANSKIVFIPFARPGGISWDGYTNTARKKFNQMGFELSGVHEGKDMKEMIAEADAIFIGGGNTFVLLTGLYENNLLELIRDSVNQGMPYIGTSAGSNVAGATMMTTNDMPVMYPPSFEALNLVSFVINPHYLDPDPDSKHMGETRETRIREYHVFNDYPVVGLREGAMLQISDDEILLEGDKGARLFLKGQDPQEFRSGDYLNSYV
jgi:dipeptidase E